MYEKPQQQRYQQQEQYNNREKQPEGARRLHAPDAPLPQAPQATSPTDDDYYYTLSIVTSLTCLFSGGWLALPLTIIAAYLSLTVRFYQY